MDPLWEDNLQDVLQEEEKLSQQKAWNIDEMVHKEIACKQGWVKALHKIRLMVPIWGE